MQKVSICYYIFSNIEITDTLLTLKHLHIMFVHLVPI